MKLATTSSALSLLPVECSAGWYAPSKILQLRRLLTSSELSNALGEHSSTAIDDRFAGKKGIRAGPAKLFENKTYRSSFRKE